MFEHSFFEECIPINERLRLWGEGLQIFLNYLLWWAVVNYRVSSQRVVSATLEPLGEGLGLPRGWSTDFIWVS